MAKPIAADYQTPFLLPPCLEDWIPRNHPARFIREFVNNLPWERLGFQAQVCLEGRPPYSNQMLLQVWLFAYLNKIRSHRALEKACHEQISLLWLTGLNYPDHNTLWRFWSQNKDPLHNVFKQSVKVAVGAGLVGLVLQAVDGTRIQAACSGRSAWTKEQMEELETALDSEIRQTEANILRQGEDHTTPGYQLTPELSQAAKLKETIQEGLKQLEQESRKHYHSKDSEARRMKCEGRNRFAYNAQAVVDDKAGLITAAEVVNQENDIGQLVPMLEQAKENVGAPAEQNVADSGYGSGTDLLAAQKTEFNVITAVVPSAGQDRPYHSSKFEYNKQSNILRCPRGEMLHLERERHRRNQRIQVFRCKNRDCPVRNLCSRDPKGRMVDVWESRDILLAMQRKLATPEGRQAMKRRRETVERQFAQVKQHLGFRRWTASGLKNAQAQWSMICLAINLQILMKRKLS